LSFIVVAGGRSDKSYAYTPILGKGFLGKIFFFEATCWVAGLYRGLNLKDEKLMKKIFWMAFAWLLAVGAVQAQDETKTLFGQGGPKSWGLMVSPGFQVGRVYGETAVFTQLKAGVVLNGNWTIGGFGGVTPMELYPAGLQAQFAVPTDFRLHTAGVFAEYRIKPNNLVHLAFPLAVGGLGIDMDDRDWDGLDFDDEGEDYRLFVEPGVQLELNLHKFARLYAGVSYRLHGGSFYSEGVAVPATGDYLLVNAGLKVGFFEVGDLKRKKK
jgi:hypothetical protein